MTPQELIAETAGPINEVGAIFYFDPATLAKGKTLGLDGMRFYLLGRGGVLGDVEAPVITSAFGYFSPDLISKLWNSARQVMAPRDCARAYLDANADIGRARLGGVDQLDAFCAAAEQAISDHNPAALALYAGVAAEPLPDDLAGRAMHLCLVHRELRGSIHIAAIIASGLSAPQAHVIRQPERAETFGWTSGVSVPADGTERLAAADALTDQMNAAAYASLTDAQRQAFVDGTIAIHAACSAD